MVIVERALLMLMKRDYKNGYTVSKDFSLDSKQTLYMHGDDWCVQMEWGKVPEKVLALIVEHMRDLPQSEQAFTIKRKEETTCVTCLKYHFPEISGEELADKVKIRRTPLIYGDYAVWQKTGNKGCVMISADTSEAIMRNEALFINGGIYAEGVSSRIFINARIFPGEDEKQKAINALSKESWV